MIISVASGKGGTGKTTIAVNLAVSLERDVLLLDCDVEAPNTHLFLTPVISGNHAVCTPVPRIDTDKCSFCKKCMEICRFNAIAVLKRQVLVFDNLCHSCGGCVEICPEKAVKEIPKVLGEIQTGQAGRVRVSQGRLKIGEVMVPPVIKQLRAKEVLEDIIIIDAPPGTSCPVIAAVNRSDFILLVTEPTPFGLHDLKLAVDTARLLNVPCGIVVNRAGLGNSEVHDYARKEKIPVLMEIPFDRQIAESYSNGVMIVDTMPKLKDEFINLFEKINRILENKETV
jgi:MinD superfamily P-loop ATPase